LADKFIKQLCYNIDVAPTRHELEVMSYLPNESFATYVGRLMALAAKVKVVPPVHESSQTDMVLKTTSNPLARYILLGDFSFFFIIHLQRAIKWSLLLKWVYSRPQLRFWLTHLQLSRSLMIRDLAPIKTRSAT
jgi:hypothetical protein